MPPIEIPGGTGKAVRLQRGQAVKLVNIHGTQVVDTWCLSEEDHSEYVSVEHTRRMLFRLFPREGDLLFSNRRHPLLSLEQDTSGCNHDMLLACCDPWLYKHYGCPDGHANCHENCLSALAALAIDAHTVPNPINFWMNIPISENERIALESPTSKAGDFVVLRALRDVIVIFSACPMDVTPINGADRTPKAVTFEVLQA
jgi:hypothetical protein